MPRHKDANPNELQGIGGAINFICKQLNDFYDGKVYTNYLSKPCAIVRGDFDSYIKILNYFWKVLKAHPIYSVVLKKDDLARGWDGNIINKILDKIDN
jgi:hypothetical protein